MPHTRYHWLPNLDCVMHETDETGNTTVQYTCEPAHFGPLISERRDGAEHVHHYDALGSTVALTDLAGDVTDTLAYDAWGNTTSRSGTTLTDYRWCGITGYRSSLMSHAHYVRSRVYDSVLALWRSPDPINRIFPGTLLKRQPPYTYVDNTPTSLYDPSGTFGISYSNTMAVGELLELSFAMSGGGIFIELGGSSEGSVACCDPPFGGRQWVSKNKGYFQLGIGVDWKVAKVFQVSWKIADIFLEAGKRCESACVLPPPMPNNLFPVGCCNSCVVAGVHTPVWLPVAPYLVPGYSIGGGFFGIEMSGALFLQGDVRVCDNAGLGCTNPGLHVGGCLSLNGQLVFSFAPRFAKLGFGEREIMVVSGSICFGTGGGFGGGVSPW